MEFGILAAPDRQGGSQYLKQNFSEQVPDFHSSPPFLLGVNEIPDDPALWGSNSLSIPSNHIFHE